MLAVAKTNGFRRLFDRQQTCRKQKSIEDLNAYSYFFSFPIPTPCPTSTVDFNTDRDSNEVRHFQFADNGTTWALNHAGAAGFRMVLSQGPTNQLALDRFTDEKSLIAFPDVKEYEFKKFYLKSGIFATLDPTDLDNIDAIIEQTCPQMSISEASTWDITVQRSDIEKWSLNGNKLVPVAGDSRCKEL